MVKLLSQQAAIIDQFLWLMVKKKHILIPNKIKREKKRVIFLDILGVGRDNK